MHKSYTNGFTTITAILIGVILGVLTLGGLYIYQVPELPQVNKSTSEKAIPISGTQPQQQIETTESPKGETIPQTPIQSSPKSKQETPPTTLQAPTLISPPQILNQPRAPSTPQAQTSQPSTITITSCQDIQKSGNYVLGGDITLESSNSFISCLNIHDVNNIQIDCKDHTISAIPPIGMTNVRGFSLRNCNLEERGYEKYGSPVPFQIKNAKDGVIESNAFKDMFVDINNSSNVKVINNKFSHLLQQTYSINNLIEANLFKLSRRENITGMIVSSFGSNNKIIKNNIDGGWDGIHNNQIGADDGIIITDEAGDVINDNVIRNNWDCGIETGGIISNTEMINNTILNNDICGIGAWHANSWTGNTVSNNLIDRAPIMFLFYRDVGLRQQGFDPELHIRPADTKMYFLNNTFKNNKFINPLVQPGLSFPSSRFDIPNSLSLSNLDTHGERPITPNDVVVGNNIFISNDFGTTLSAPSFTPKGMIIDGGNNICASTSESDYPLRCKSAP